MGVLTDDMGRLWFLLSILILSIFTYLMAIYIQNILDFFNRRRPVHGPNIWTWRDALLNGIFGDVKTGDPERDAGQNT